jgi:uncharacterized membrane protein YkvA (DUF1232 family)
MSRTAKKNPQSSPSETLFQASDFRGYLTEKSALIAPADVESLLSRSEDVSRKALGDAERHPLLRRQVEVALQLLADHEAGTCPQIPYQTVALLAVAALYLLNPNDVIPDCITDIGTSDDAIVFELAFEMGARGIERYCTYKDISSDGLFAKRDAPPRRRSR